MHEANYIQNNFCFKWFVSSGMYQWVRACRHVWG